MLAAPAFLAPTSALVSVDFEAVGLLSEDVDEDGGVVVVLLSGCF